MSLGALFLQQGPVQDPSGSGSNAQALYPQVVNAARGVKNVFQVTAGSSTPIMLLGPNPKRKGAQFYNNGSVVVWLGNSPSLTTGNGFPLSATTGTTPGLTDAASCDSWYALAASSTAAISVIEYT